MDRDLYSGLGRDFRKAIALLMHEIAILWAHSK